MTSTRNVRPGGQRAAGDGSGGRSGSTGGSAGGGQKKKRRRRIRWWRVLLLLIVLVMLAGAGAATGIVLSAMRTMPSIETLRPQPTLTSFIYDANGNQAVAIPAIENRLPVDINNVPKHVQNAFVAIEDARFWEHHGVDPIGIMRAAWADLRHGNHGQGASTITQQLARNAFPIGSTRQGMAGWQRKIQEAILAIELERHFTKDEILQSYLTWVPFGNHAYGIEAAAHTYFNKSASELTLSEGALLAGLPNAPSALNPFVHPDAAKERRNVVLDRMADLGFITASQADEAKSEPLGVQPEPVKSPADYKYAYFVDYVIDQLEAKGFTDQQIFGGGLRVYTTLVPQVQEAIQDAVKKNFAALAKVDKAWAADASPEMETAAVIIDQHNGHILGMVGGRDHDTARGLNRVWQAQHQPGSAMKPLAVYTPAFVLGYTPATVVDDRPYLIQVPGQDWVPQNDDWAYQGLTTMREAVRRSVNAVAAETLQMIGVDTGWEYAQKLGLVSLVAKDKVPSLALGGITYGVTPLEMARAYGTIANGGVRTDPIAILKVTDSQGNVLNDKTGQPAVYQTTKTPVISQQVAYVMTDVLRSVVKDYPSSTGWIQNYGTAPRANIQGRDVAGKTGTTSDSKALWFVGFTPRYTGAVWVGYDHEQELEKASGGKYAAPIWHDMMVGALKGLKPETFQQPDNIVHRVIDIKSGELVGPDTPAADQRTEVFVEGTEPTAISSIWVQKQVPVGHPDALWTPGCPYAPVMKTFLNRPPLTFDDIKPIAQVYFGDKYTDAKAQRFIPKDMALAVPTNICGYGSEAPPTTGIIGGGGSESEPGGGSERVYKPVTVKMTIGHGKISPSAIETHVDQQVTLIVQNLDKNKDHEIVVKDWDFDVKIPAGKTVTVTVVPHKKDAPYIRCIVKGHYGELARWFVTE